MLLAATVVGHAVKLPPGQLERRVYVEVNEVLSRLGGTWKGGKVGAHLFDDVDPAPLLAEVLATGTMTPKNPTAFFATPAPVAEELVDAMGLRSLNAIGRRLLEPSAGHGGIAEVVRGVAPLATLETVELLPRSVAVLRARGFAVYEGDFLAFAPGARYDAIAMNPPFAVAGDPLAWITHIEHALTLLAPGGVLGAIAPQSLAFRSDRRTTALREKVLANGAMWGLPASSFADSGTAVNTMMVVMRPDRGAEP